jgi:hypothetical protein
MKKFITIITLLLTTISFSQQITLDKGKFYYKGSQIDSRQARNLFATNIKAAALFKQAKSKEALGGFVLGLGIGLTVGDLAIGLFSDKEYPTAMTYAGVGAMAVSIPILCGRKKRYEEAVKIYNSEHKENALGATNTTYQLNAIANQNGFGFRLKF